MLDVGAGSGIDRPDWMHALVASVATEVVGIELDHEARRARSRTGIRRGRRPTPRTFDLGRSFEVVWAGEIIEHLSCAGGFLDAARRHLAPGGRLVITTPNAFAVSNFVYRIGGRPRINKGHTCWYDEVTLSQLLRAPRIRGGGGVVPGAPYARTRPAVAGRRGAIVAAPTPRGEHAARGGDRRPEPEPVGQRRPFIGVITSVRRRFDGDGAAWLTRPAGAIGAEQHGRRRQRTAGAPGRRPPSSR